MVLTDSAQRATLFGHVTSIRRQEYILSHDTATEDGGAEPFTADGLN